jgi:hypothetical protein
VTDGQALPKIDAGVMIRRRTRVVKRHPDGDWRPSLRVAVIKLALVTVAFLRPAFHGYQQPHRRADGDETNHEQQSV